MTGESIQNCSGKTAPKRLPHPCQPPALLRMERLGREELRRANGVVEVPRNRDGRRHCRGEPRRAAASPTPGPWSSTSARSRAPTTARITGSLVSSPSPNRTPATDAPAPVLVGHCRQVRRQRAELDREHQRIELDVAAREQQPGRHARDDRREQARSACCRAAGRSRTSGTRLPRWMPSRPTAPPRPTRRRPSAAGSARAADTNGLLTSSGSSTGARIRSAGVLDGVRRSRSSR